MIRAMDRFYEKHPTLAFLIALAAAFAIMYIAKDWDRADTAALRLQMMASKGTV
jgi:hypothetical protein